MLEMSAPAPGDATPAEPLANSGGVVSAILAAARPAQWVKNLVLPLPFLFGGALGEPAGWALAAAGFATTEERDTTCCYAKQDKFWVQGTPDGERWEVYTITDDLTDVVVEESREHLTGDAQPCCA